MRAGRWRDSGQGGRIVVGFVVRQLWFGTTHCSERAVAMSEHAGLDPRDAKLDEFKRLEFEITVEAMPVQGEKPDRR